MTDFFHSVVVVGFESKSNPTDDWGIESVCENIIAANQQIEVDSKEFPLYRFFVMGDYEVIQEQESLNKNYIFSDTGDHAVVGYLDYELKLGHIIPAMHFDGIIYDCEVVEIIDKTITLRKRKVNDIFYQTTIRERMKYE